MKQETLKVLEDSSAILTISTGAATSATKTFGWLDYLDIHAAGIGVLLTVFFGIGYLTFHFLSLRKQSIADKYKAKLDNHIKETKDEFKKVSGGIQTILDKLDKQG